jgi:hypothetical protein
MLAQAFGMIEYCASLIGFAYKTLETAPVA